MGTVNARAWALAALSQVLSGCAVTLTGLVVDRGAGVALQESDGHELRLVLSGDALPMQNLQGHLARVQGRRGLGAVAVTDWQVLEGVHGLQAWVGELRWHGAQLGLVDRNSGGFYLLDDGAVSTLAPLVEGVVLVEGYVVGPNRVKVVAYRDLDPARRRAAGG